MRPLVRELWSRGGLTVVTMGAYHFSDWANDRADIEYGLRIVDPKTAL